jgi:ubiquinone/menaquinone biosynthesis C-methylase UbiE
MSAAFLAAAPVRAREPFRPDWSSDEAVAAYRRWYAQLVLQGQAARDALLDAARVTPGIRALDLASGFGESALALAERVGPTGHVSAVDPNAESLHFAEQNALRRGLGNLSFQPARAEALPYPDGTFELVTCGFGLPYFDAAAKGLGETLRVLRPGGRAVFSAWGPIEQPYFASTVGVFARYVAVPAASSESPQHFRFARAGTLSGTLARVGFDEVWEEHRIVPWIWPGPPVELWQHFLEAETGFRALVESLPPGELAAAVAEAVGAFGLFYDGSEIRMPATIVLASGTKR